MSSLLVILFIAFITVNQSSAFVTTRSLPSCSSTGLFRPPTLGRTGIPQCSASLATAKESTTDDTASDDDTSTSSTTTISFQASIQEIDRRRILAIISHPDSGKTTMTEKLLLY